MTMTAGQYRATTNRETRRRDRRRGNTLTNIQHRCPGWVGRLRFAMGIRSPHPWAKWPLRRIAGLDFMEAGGHQLRKDLRAIQVALAGYGVRG